MPVVINEVNSRINAIDPSAVLTEDVLRAVVDRVVTELDRRSSADAERRLDQTVHPTRLDQD